MQPIRRNTTVQVCAAAPARTVVDHPHMAKKAKKAAKKKVAKKKKR
jgi:hypothetical protein